MKLFFIRLIIFIFITTCFVAGCLVAAPFAEEGIASVYWEDRLVSNGSTFSPQQMTAAHWTLPIGTFVKVTHGKRSILVRIFDRGPHPRLHRMIDLTPEGARHLGLPRMSLVKVKMELAHAPIPRPRIAYENRPSMAERK